MENFVLVPNLPVSNVSLAVVDGRISNEIEQELIKNNIRLIKTEKIDGLDNAISFHPDMMMHHLGGKDIIVAKNISQKIVYALEDEGFNVICGRCDACGSYPYDVCYNVARIGNAAFCNMKYTDEVLLENLYKRNIKIIDVKQGYSKCSICVVSFKSAVTSDRGLHNILNNNGIETLLITPGSIKLFDYNYGFIGGSSGFISKDTMAFFGNIANHPDYISINSFLIKNGKKLKNLGKNILWDFGTLLPLKEYSILMQ